MRCCTSSLLLFQSLSLLAATGLGSPPKGSASLSVNVPATAYDADSSVSPGFVGLSVELYDAQTMLSAPGLPRCLKNMNEFTLPQQSTDGPTIRVGGDSSDTSCWKGASSPGCACSYNITEADLQGERALHASPHVKFWIYMCRVEQQLTSQYCRITTSPRASLRCIRAALSPDERHFCPRHQLCVRCRADRC